MNRVLGISMIVGGGVLIFFGLRASDSLSSDVSRFFSGNPTDNALWFLVGGAASVVAGLVLSVRTSWSRT